MIAGIKLSDSEDKISGIAFIEEELSTFSVKKDEEILDILEEKQPEVIAFNAHLKPPEKEENFREEEKDLIDDGYALLPYGMGSTVKLSRRALSLKSRLSLDIETGFIECDPETTREILEIQGDNELQNYGMDPEDTENTQEFGAVLAALTALFYSRGDFEDHGIVTPPIESDEDSQD